MSVLVLMSGSESRLDAIKKDFADQGFHEPVWIPTDDFDPAAVEVVLAWKPGRQPWSRYPNVRLVQSWGAGVDHLLDAGLPGSWPVARFMSKSLRDRMVRYVCSQLNNWQLDMPYLLQAEREKRWGWHEGRWGERVLILGMGELGQSVAKGLVAQGYAVDGWSRSAKHIPGVRSLTGDDDLQVGLRDCDYLINLLPLTASTRGLLSLELWSHCLNNPVLMNVGRGASLKEVDLIPALDEGRLGGAILDVFETEPLPEDHEFWERPDIWVTPHIASISDPRDVIALAIDNLQRVRNGEEPRHPVDLSREY